MLVVVADDVVTHHDIVPVSESIAKFKTHPVSDPGLIKLDVGISDSHGLVVLLPTVRPAPEVVVASVNESIASCCHSAMILLSKPSPSEDCT